MAASMGGAHSSSAENRIAVCAASAEPPTNPDAAPVTDEESLSVVLLHQHPELMKQCCELVNAEWPRSETARMMSFSSSCDEMPTNLVLLDDEKRVVGHGKLTPIPSIDDGCFVETVVVSKALRGRGLGSFLMQAAEKYCKDALSLKTVYLSTIDREGFYRKLGYEECEPVSIYGSAFQPHPVIKVKRVESKTDAPPPPPLPISKPNSKPSKIYMAKSL